jgi:hypothetical protein
MTQVDGVVVIKATAKLEKEVAAELELPDKDLEDVFVLPNKEDVCVFPKE